MRFFLYLRLMVLTAGTLLPFFWIVVILGHRRQRNFERIFFFLCLSLIFFFGASLLQLNAQLFYPTIPPGLTTFAWTLVCLGLWFLPALLLHLHVEYAQIREMLRAGGPKWLWLLAAYGPVVVFSPKLIAALRLSEGYSFLLPTNAFGIPFQLWMIVALAVCAGWQWEFLKASPDSEQKSFHRTICFNLSFVALWVVLLHFVLPRWGSVTEQSAEVYTSIVGLFALGPLIGLIRNVQRFNFLQIGRQRNLIFTVFAVFVALLYLSLIRRFTQWLEPYFPPEATAAILLFLPVMLFEPLQRFVGRILRRTAHAELDRAQSLFAEIQREARLGNVQKLSRFIENLVRETLELSSVKVILQEPPEITEAMREFAKKHGGTGDLSPGPPRCELVVWGGQEHQVYRTIGNVIAIVHVRPHGAALSGETQAALEFLCEQLPGALDLCRLIEEKLKLERELAERERLAVLGQMAASISHNLKNPLGSMKTILQVQLENPELPETIRGETKMVLEEIGRLSTKLNQLLQFSRPAVIGEGSAARCDASEIAREVVRVLGPEAQKRGVALEMKSPVTELKVAASAGAVSDVLTNLVVNAMDATVRGGCVEVEVAQKDGNVVFTVEDDGPGVPAELREKILQPFFTTKAQGTGLGLAIVARRATDAGGRLEFESPAKNNRGAKFSVWLPTGAGAR